MSQPFDPTVFRRFCNKIASAQPLAQDASVITRKSGKVSKAAVPEPPKTRAQALFQGQNNPKKRKKIVRLEQWIEVRIRNGQP